MSDLETWADKLKIVDFRGVFMRERLPENPHKNECAIINLDDSESGGTHWTCYTKKDNRVIYFDSFGEAPPPLELKEYLNMAEGIFYNHARYQDYEDPPICGHLCLEVLLRFSRGQDFNAIERALQNDKYTFLRWFE